MNSKKINIFLDDIRLPSMSHRSGKGLGEQYSDLENWTIVRDFFEFKYLIDNQFDSIDLISFDHDLACVIDGVEYTGKSAADYLINFCLDNNKKIPNWFVHSDNTSGKQNIIGTLISYLNKIEGVDTSDFRYFHNGFINNRPI